MISKTELLEQIKMAIDHDLMKRKDKGFYAPVFTDVELEALMSFHLCMQNSRDPAMGLSLTFFSQTVKEITKKILEFKLKPEKYREDEGMRKLAQLLATYEDSLDNNRPIKLAWMLGASRTDDQ